MLTLYAAYNFPAFLKGVVRDLRALWALEELGLPHDIRWLDTAKGEQREAANRAVNPFGKIPSLTDGELKLFESGAIVSYLYEKAGRAPRDAAARAAEAQWSFAALNTVEPVLFEIFMWDRFWTERPGRETRRAEVISVAKTRIADLDRALAGRTSLSGAGFGAADILMATVARFALHEPETFADAGHVRAYLDAAYARPAFSRALARQGTGPET